MALHFPLLHMLSLELLNQLHAPKSGTKSIELHNLIEVRGRANVVFVNHLLTSANSHLPRLCGFHLSGSVATV